MESLGYVFVYFARGSLPWQDLKTEKGSKEGQAVQREEMSLLGEKFCEGHLPGEFVTFIGISRPLGLRDKPGYAYLRRIFGRLFRSKGFKYNNVFD